MAIKLNFKAIPDDILKKMAHDTLHAGGNYDAPPDVSEIQKLREDLEGAVSVLQGLAERLRSLEDAQS